MFRSAPAWSILVLIGTAGLVLTPIVSLTVTALSGDASVWPRLASHVMPAALAETAALLIGVALLAGTMGLGTAWLVTVHRFPGRDALAWLLPLPLAVPTYITAYIYVEILDAAGPVQSALRGAIGWQSRGEYWFPEIRSLGGCIAVMSFVLYPYVYLTARTMFMTQSASMLEVARTLGASRFQLFRTVALPLARPALAVGLALALLEALNDIGAAEHLGVRTLTVSIYTTWLNQGSLPGAAQIACTMLVLVVGLILLERAGRRSRRYAGATRRHRPPAPVPLTGFASLASFVACALPVALGFVLPVGFLLSETLRRGLLTQFDADFMRHLATTVGVAVTATVAALLLGIVAVTAARLARRGLTEAMTFVLSLGYALPGTVLALGLLSPLIATDEILSALTQGIAGQRVSLFLMGSGVGIVIAYLIRFLPIATGSLGAGLARVSPNLEDAARMLGASPRELVLRVQLPLLRPTLATAALLVFVDCAKELPATLLLRPLNTETLATLVYGHAARGSFEDGALAALAIVVVGLWPAARLTRSAELPGALPGARSAP